MPSRVCFLSSFFFSSRRRHTRLQGDWSSDVCSSDLIFDHLDRQDVPLDEFYESRLRLLERYDAARSEEHTSELQSPCNLVCRLLLEKKKRTGTCPLYTTPSAPRSFR